MKKKKKSRLKLTTPLLDKYLSDIDVRVDIARMEFYRQFSKSISETDFYIETLFNTFIATVQVPLNFAIFRDKKLLFHLVNDQKYHDIVTDECKIKYDQIDNKELYEFFPSIFDGKYHILILHMHSKLRDESIFEVLDHSNFQEYSHTDFDPNKEGIDSLDRYLQRNAFKFFYCPWDSFSSQFSNILKRALNYSIKRHSKNFRSKYESKKSKRLWPPSPNRISKEIAKVKYPNKNSEAWHEILRSKLAPVLSARNFGVHALHGMTLAKSETDDYGELPNVLFSYRTFSREAHDLRRPNEKLGYPYDTQILVPDISNKVSKKHHHVRKFLKRLAKNGKDQYEEWEGVGRRSRVSYGNLFNSEASEVNKLLPTSIRELDDVTRNRYIEIYRDVTAKADQMFWTKIDSEIDSVLHNFGQPVSKKTRSFSDPVYHTGVIHINKLFESGGLDRLSKIDIDNFKLDEFIRENRDDLLRIVTLYYVFCEMAGSPDDGDFDPRRLAAVMVPTKMRGSVFGIVIYATHIMDLMEGEKLKRDYQGLYNIHNVPLWIANFQLMTAVGDISLQKIDEILWENAMNRVSDVISRRISLVKADEDIREVLYPHFNKKMLGEQLLIPYAMPQLIFEEFARKEDNKVTLKGASGRDYDFYWNVQDNPFFLASQTWNKKSSRSFHDAIEIGIRRGLELLSAGSKPNP